MKNYQLTLTALLLSLILLNNPAHADTWKCIGNQGGTLFIASVNETTGDALIKPVHFEYEVAKYNWFTTPDGVSHLFQAGSGLYSGSIMQDICILAVHNNPDELIFGTSLRVN